MGKPKGIRRFLRFSLRSLMLVTLAVAGWLGYEVHQARTVQRQAEAIRALGGEVEFEASPWSLLRLLHGENEEWIDDGKTWFVEVPMDARQSFWLKFEFKENIPQASEWPERKAVALP